MSDSVQDAVTFLEDTCRLYPDATHLLNTVQLLALDMSPQEPFTKGNENEEFLRLTEAYFVTKQSIEQTKFDLRASLTSPRSSGKPLNVDGMEKVIACLEKVFTKNTQSR